MSKPFCSVVVCTYNRSDHLRGCLKKIQELDYDNYEIVVVDDGSTDDTKNFLKEIESEKIKIVRHEKNKGVSASRNSGIKASGGEIIAFTDDDCRVSRDWLKHLLAPFADLQIMFVIGRTEYVSEGYVGYFPERLVKNPFAHWPMVGNMAYRKEVFTEIGMFDDKNFKNVNEDTEMGIRAVANGFKFARALDAVIFHERAIWTVPSLLKSAKNASSWVSLSEMYPSHHDFFGRNVRWGFAIQPFDYLIIFLSPIIVPILFVRYLWHGKRNIWIFLAKWPCYLFLKRFYIYKEALAQRKFYV